MSATSSNKQETSVEVQSSVSNISVVVRLERHAAKVSVGVQFHDYAAVKADIHVDEEDEPRTFAHSRALRTEHFQQSAKHMSSGKDRTSLSLRERRAVRMGRNIRPLVIKVQEPEPEKVPTPVLNRSRAQVTSDHAYTRPYPIFEFPPVQTLPSVPLPTYQPINPPIFIEAGAVFVYPQVPIYLTYGTHVYHQTAGIPQMPYNTARPALIYHNQILERLRMIYAALQRGLEVPSNNWTH